MSPASHDEPTRPSRPQHPGPRPWGERLAEAVDAHGPLCVGIDPHESLLRRWGLTPDVHGLRTFTLTCAEAFAGAVAVVKPQSAFFEQHGSHGVAVLEELLEALRSSGTLCLLDVKRGDIGSTMEAYARAYLGDDSPLRADAVTVSPYLGFGSLRPALDLARSTGRGVYVLGLTSNPDGPAVQHVGRAEEGGAVARRVAQAAAAENAQAHGRLGHVGLVIGATVGDAVDRLGIDLPATRASLLAPGLGAQGASGEDLRRVFGPALPQVLGSVSRGVLAAGPSRGALRVAACSAARELAGMVTP